MKIKSIFFYFLLIALLTSCGQSNANYQKNNVATYQTPKNKSQDSLGVINAFVKLKTNKKFLKDLGFENGEQYSWSDVAQIPIFGDLDNDGNPDALLPASIEGRGGGNNWDAHYVVFLNKNGVWKYENQLDAGGDWAEFIIQFNEIKNGIILGSLKTNDNSKNTNIPVEYILKNGELVNTYTALHKVGKVEREFLTVYNILTPENQVIPITSTLKDYEKILGKGKIETPKIQPECGTYFEEGIYRSLNYPLLEIELDNKNKAALITVNLIGSGYKIQTDKGTITELTSFKQIKSLFYNQKDLWILDIKEKDISTELLLACCDECDDYWRFSFNKKGGLVKMYLFIQC